MDDKEGQTLGTVRLGTQVGAPNPYRLVDVACVTMEPAKAKLTHPFLRGFGISILVSVVYVFAFMYAFAFRSSLSMPMLLPLLVISFVPAFLLVNIVVASYYSYRHTGVIDYVIGAVVAFVFDIGFLWVLFIAAWFLIALGSGGQ